MVTSTPAVVAFPESEVDLSDAFLRGLPTNATRTAYRQGLKQLRAFMGDRSLLTATRRDIESYRAHLEALGRSPLTISKLLSGLSGFYAFALDEGAVNRNPVVKARRPKLPQTSPRQALSHTEVHSLLTAPDQHTLIGLRDFAFISVLAVQGFRLAETLHLSVEDLGEEQGHRVVRVVGKGGKILRVPLAESVENAITRWTTSAGITTGPVFIPVTKDSKVVAGKPISSQSAWRRICYLSRKAGLSRHIHAHLFRHSAITAALEAGMPLHIVQDFARHNSPVTTRRYDGHRHSLSNESAHVLSAVYGVSRIQGKD